jgi:hypothetical protein
MPQIARLDRAKPRVMRRVEAPRDMWLDDLHVIVQGVMGAATTFASSSLDAAAIGRSRSGPRRILRARDADVSEAALANLLAQCRGTSGETFEYHYDFGDSWQRHRREGGRSGAERPSTRA